MKISLFNGDVENVSKLSDRPNIENGYTSRVLKELFDKAGVDLKNYINTVLIEELTSSAESASGADRIGSGYIETVPGESIQEKLINIANQIKDLANGTIPDGSVSPEKFSPEIAAFLTSASIKVSYYLRPGNYTFRAPRGGTYKITLVGGGAGGGVDPSFTYYSLGGGGGASSVVWIDFEEGDVCSVTVGKGGDGMTVSGNQFSTHAKAGGNTVVTLNGELIAQAEGGWFGLGKRAQAQGGDLNYSGGYPQVGEYYGGSGDHLEFSIGGDSVLGNGGAFEDDTPGIGGGGYAGKYLSSNMYSQGHKGGDGAVVIEYLG